jgi:hypothetical protein
MLANLLISAAHAADAPAARGAAARPGGSIARGETSTAGAARGRHPGT